MHAIQNYDVYNVEMTKSLMDKMFFVDKIDFDVLVDFGCADGALICNMARLFPMSYFGYDIDKRMIDLCLDNWRRFAGFGPVTALFSDIWDDGKPPLVSEAIMPRVRAKQEKGKKTCLVLNSLIHEVYSYGDKESVAKFWDQVLNSGFDYIVIRDMVWDDEFTVLSPLVGQHNVRERADPKMLKEFEAIWGSIRTNRNLVHFLMKYRYEENWNREVHENYFPISRHQLLRTVQMGSYKIKFQEDFQVPFTHDKIMEDFGVDLKQNTHIKLILEKA